MKNNPLKYSFALFWLSINFIKATVASGVSTARIILFKPQNPNSGLCEMDYADLDGFPLVLLGMLITLTPGSTLIDINQEQKTMLIHLLDLDTETHTKQQIQHDYITHLMAWSAPKKENQ